MNKISRNYIRAIAASLCIFLPCICPSAAHADDGNEGPYRQRSDAHDSSVETFAQWLIKNQAPLLNVPSNINTGDDTNRLTADANANPESAALSDWARCASTTIGKVANSPIISDETYTNNCSLPNDASEDTSSPGRLPTTQEILLAAANLIHADGAGLHKRPDGVSYTNKHIPTLVAATHPTQTHVINLLGHDITITLRATSYTWSWGDGTPDLTTTSPGVPWHKGMKPNTDPTLIRHYYTPPNGWRSRFDGPYPNATRTITLTTTWAGTATNPFTGETQTINGLVTTTETTGPFRLSHLLISNTDTWEESQGH